MTRFLGQLRMRKETKNTEPIVRLNDDDAFLGKILPVVTRFAISASDKSTAVEPNQNR